MFLEAARDFKCACNYTVSQMEEHNFNAGKGFIKRKTKKAAIAGGNCWCKKHIHELAVCLWRACNFYIQTTVQKSLLPWIDGLLDASEKTFLKKTGKPLYSFSHDRFIGRNQLKKNIEICKGYLARMSKMGMTLEN